MTWRRADLGELPERGQIISVVRYTEAGGVSVVERLHVASVIEGTDHVIFGPSLPFNSDERIELPGQPDEFNGPVAILWKGTA